MIKYSLKITVSLELTESKLDQYINELVLVFFSSLRKSDKNVKKSYEI